jgi:hypothetical protein
MEHQTWAPQAVPLGMTSLASMARIARHYRGRFTTVVRHVRLSLDLRDLCNAYFTSVTEIAILFPTSCYVRSK